MYPRLREISIDIETGRNTSGKDFGTGMEFWLELVDMLNQKNCSTTSARQSKTIMAGKSFQP
jgi:hypothetical protein